jgi:NAD-dependent dihydropyrimidine dehydrogenase PreA subunit
MAYVIAEPCIGVKDTACVDACPVDWLRANPYAIIRESPCPVVSV